MDYSTNKFSELFNLQKANQNTVANTSYKQRIKKLNTLKTALEKTYKTQLHEAMYKDFKKHPLEVDLSEIYPVISEIKHVKKHLKNWMEKQKAVTPLALLGSSSWIRYEPKGVCLIISPWNYPINLTFAPLVSAIAAGNTVIIKPSEITSNTSKIMDVIINDLFEEREVVLIQGGVETSTELLQLPFNHIFFTGSSKVGKIVMQAAAINLSSVTLELGGKSPTIVDSTANLNMAAKHIAWGKTLNNGQTCIAPDYVLVHESIKDEFINNTKKWVQKYYSNAIENSRDYCRIVSDNHFNRIKNLLDDALEKGAKMASGGKANGKEKFIEPTILTDIPENAQILNEEIFGPILPILTFKTLEDVSHYINSRDIPLALYIYSRNKKHTNYLIKNTRAGTSCINTNMTQFGNPNLPFGGSNNSGFGKTHGLYGFQSFSNMRAILKQHTNGPSELLYPPYNDTKEKIMNATIKWF